MTGHVRTFVAVVVGMLLVEARHATDTGQPAVGLALTIVAIAAAGALTVLTIADHATTRRQRRAGRRWEARARMWRHRARDAQAANVVLRDSTRAWRRLAEDRGRALEAAGLDLDDAIRATGFAGTLAEIRDLPDLTGPTP